jgi:hypothetical protein
MPIRTNLNESPYYDDYDITSQYHRVLFRPGYAVQARELTQLQTILQNQVEQFGDNIFKEGTIIKGCNFTELSSLKYVKVGDNPVNIANPGVAITVNQFVGGIDEETGIETFYEILGTNTQLRALIISASFGFETNDPDLNTFYINYLNSNEAQDKVFEQNETLEIYKYTIEDDVTSVGILVAEFSVTGRANHVGNSFGIESAVGIIYQKGHFLYAKQQNVILSKYTNVPNNISVGYRVNEQLITSLTDTSLYDNSIGTPNQNAPGANRLKLEPILVAIPTSEANADSTFFTLARYINGSAVQTRDVSQYNVLGEEMARRTFEESGNYKVRGFKTKVTSSANGAIQAAVEPGVAYVKGFRIENKAEIFVPIDQLKIVADEEGPADTLVQQNQPVSFNYGSYVDIANTAVLGTLPVGTYATANLKNIGGTTIGTAKVRNYTPSRVYLSDIRMGANNFAEVASINNSSGSGGSVKIIPTIKQKSNDTLIFNVGETFIKSITDISISVRKTRTLTGVISDSFTLTALTGEDFNVQLDDTLIVADTTQDNLQISSIVKDSATQITINLVPGQTPPVNGTIYYNSRDQVAEPYNKLDRTLYVKASYSSATTKYSLGFPDVYKIVSIVDSGNNDVTNSFRLKTNQQDHYYDLSYIEYIPGRPVPDTGLMTITVKAFKLDISTGSYFFTVDSYPNDFDLSLIPTYTTSSGVNLNLRNCIDFRPYAANTVAYTAAEVLGTAPTVSTAVGAEPTFSGTFMVPALNSAATLDYEYFLNRTDIITVDSYGKFSIVKGSPAKKSRAPTVGDDRLVISEVYIPGYPAISSDRASLENKAELAVKTKSLGNKNYTMKEIGDLDQKISRLFYYMSVSMLEASTENLNITDENGITRFKNGILVDPFNDLSIADVKNNEFNAAIDFTEKSLTPAVKTIPINLKYKTSSNVSLHPSGVEIDAATLETSVNTPIITQPYANSFRNCVSNFYDYRGTGFLFPEYDGAFDTVTAPAPNIEIDMATPFIEFTEALQEFVPLTSTQSTLLGSRVEEIGRTTAGKGRKARTTSITTQQTDIIQDITRSLQVSEGRVNEQNLGEFVTNFNFNPFMRSREVRILMHGLRPDTRHYFFFDDVDVNSSVLPGIVPASDSVRDVVAAGTTVTSVISDENGSLAAIFTIPGETFYVGDRLLKISDVDNIDSIESAGTSGGTITYRAYNFSVNKQGLTLTTREPEIQVTETTTTRSVVNRPVTRNTGNDPLAQTFFVKSAMAQGADCIFASRLDLFFKRKSSTNGVTVMLREVVNGYPTAEIIPFSKVHFKSTEVNTSEKGTVATSVFFKAPVRLDVEKEYAIVIMPDAGDPDYLVYTSKVGLEDLATLSPVVMDWGDGVLFTSTNNRAWQSYQDEDLKFTLYRKEFSQSSGTLTLTNEDNEFFTLSGIIGEFRNGERVYTTKSISGSTSNTVSLSIGNTEISGTALSDTYVEGDYIYVVNNTGEDLFKVLTVSSTSITLDKPSKFSGAFTHNPAVVGDIVYYTLRNPEFMVLERSSASLSKLFATGNTITGFTSGTTATISSVDNIELSYVQPIILKTNNAVTNVTMEGTFTDPTNTDTTYTRNVLFNDKTLFNEKGCIVFSKSNGTKPFDLTLNLTNGLNTTATPFIDVETATLLAYQYKVSENTANTENTSAYVSKTIELAENLDAEDFILYTTAYRPINTDINVYIKVQHASDPLSFEVNDWIQLELVEGAEVYSSSSNINDFKEFVYKLPENPDNLVPGLIGGVLTYSNTSGEYSGYRKFAVKIEFSVSQVDGRTPIGSVPRLLDYRGVALT